MIKIKFFDSVTEARLAGNLLKEHGIANLVQEKGTEFPSDSGDSSGADVFIEEKNVQRAKEILEGSVE